VLFLAGCHNGGCGQALIYPHYRRQRRCAASTCGTGDRRVKARGRSRAPGKIGYGQARFVPHVMVCSPPCPAFA